MNNETCIYTLRSMLFEREESLKACRDKIKALAADNEFLEDLLEQHEIENEIMLDALMSIRDLDTLPYGCCEYADVILESMGY